MLTLRRWGPEERGKHSLGKSTSVYRYLRAQCIYPLLIMWRKGGPAVKLLWTRHTLL